jgi:branched-chain amino acid transport system substrate-binding protein
MMGGDYWHNLIRRLEKSQIQGGEHLKKTVFILTALLIAVVIVMAGCPSTTPTTTAPGPTTTAPGPTTTAPGPLPERTLRIGSLMALTGWFVVNDGPDWAQTVIAGNLLNEMGGINVDGQVYKVELVVEDIKSDFNGTTAAANRLVYDKGVKFIIGPTAFYNPAAAPVTEPAQVLKISTWCTHFPGEMDATTPYSFTTGHGSITSGWAALQYMRDTYPEVKKVVIVSPDDGAPPIMVPIMKPLFDSVGVTVVGDTILYPNEMVDFSPIVAQIMAVEGIDAVYQLNGVGPHVGAIVKGVREAGFDKPYITTIPTSVQEFANISGAQAAEGVSSVALSYDDPNNTPLLQEMIARITAEKGTGETLHLKGANCLFVLKEAIEAAGSVDVDAVKATIESMGTMETPFGTATICGTELLGIPNHLIANPLPIDLFTGGKQVPQDWYKTVLP